MPHDVLKGQDVPTITCDLKVTCIG